MVLDINSFREQEDPAALGPEGVREIQRKRFKDVTIVDKIMEADEGWRKARFVGDELNKIKNMCSRVMKEKKIAKEADGASELPADVAANVATLAEDKIKTLSVNQIISLSKLIDVEKEKNIALVDQLDNTRMELLRTVGNQLHETTPVFADEEHNVIVRTVGEAGPAYRKKYSHVDLITMIGGYDAPRGVVTSGNRGYYLTGPGVALELALVSYATQFLMSRGYKALSPPVFMRKEVMQEVAQLSQFDEELYKVTGKGSEKADDNTTNEMYLIATSEQPIAAFHRDEWIDVKDLPIRYVGVSECFRQEVGSHGRDTGGIFRVHQFKKIEQFCITSPDGTISWEMMEEMLKNSEDYLKSIGIPYQVVNIVSGALNLAAAKKYDVEGWFPGQGNFRELVSCSNCTDYQSRRLKIRYGQSKKLNEKVEYVHMLNSTLCATTRNICAVLENFQVGDYESGGGIVVPEVLRPFMPEQYREFIPFIAPAPIDLMNAEAAAKEAKGKDAAKPAGGKKEEKKEAKKEEKPKEDKKPKEEKKKEDKPKDDKGKKADAGKKDEKKKDEKKPEASVGGFDAKVVAAAAKEGGKKGQDLIGMCDLGGIKFHAVSMEKCEGSFELLQAAMNAMNVEVDEAAEERKGGASSLGKILLSAGSKSVAVLAHQPAALNELLTLREWLEVMMKHVGGKILEESGETIKAEIPCNPDENRFPLKLRDQAIGASFDLLKRKGLIRDDSSDSVNLGEMAAENDIEW